MSKKIRTHYDNLKIANDAPDEVIKAAHKALVQKHHPDKTENKDEAHRIIKLINEARDVLLNPTLRKEHDDWIKSQEANHYQEFNKLNNNSNIHTPQTSQNTENNWQTIGKYKVHDGLAIDTETDLMWCRFLVGQEWRHGSVQGEAIEVASWKESLKIADDFNKNGGYQGFTDWRLPTINELKTTIEKHRGDECMDIECIDSDVFINNYPTVWSSSPKGRIDVWVVNYKYGIDVSYPKEEKNGLPLVIRLVRR